MAIGELILVVDDDALIRQMLKTVLEKEGYRAVTAADGRAGLEEARRQQPALILLDLTMPLMDGYEMCENLRRQESTRSVPIIFLTGKGDKVDVIVGLGLGADDYIAKPFDIKELLARMKAQLRRSQWVQAAPDKERLVVGTLQMDRTRMEVQAAGKTLSLTVGEFRVLWALAEKPGIIFSREQILDKIHQGEMEVTDRSVDVHINSIRKKLGNAASLVQTVRGMGYRLSGAEEPGDQ